MTAAPHILVVDDDAKVRLLLRKCFEGEGFAVSEAGSGAEACIAVESNPPDLVTLDLTLPDMDGLAVARVIRAKSRTPIIMVTGKGETIDRVVGLELGADDYIAKPFHLREVLARVRAVLRRAEAVPPATPQDKAPATPSSALRFDCWVLDIAKRELRRAGTGDLVPLTTAEFALLEVFARNPHRALTRDQIMDHMKGREWNPFDRTIDNLVAKLRRKLEAEPGQPLLIKTVRSIGYIFTADVQTS